MHCPGFSDEIYAFHALNLLPAEERDELDAHLRSGCATCARQLAQSRSLWYSVGSATALVEPPSRLRANLLKAVAPPPKSWWTVWRFAGAAAALALAFGVGLFSDRIWSTDRNIVAFTAVYPAAPEQTPAPVPASQPVPQVRTITTQVADPAQARLIEALNQDLSRERQKSLQLEADLNQERTLLATTKTSAAEAEARYRAVSATTTEAVELRRQLTTQSQRAAELEKQITQYKILVEAQKRRLDQTVQIASMVTDPSLRVVRLRATEKDQAVEAHAAIAANSKMVFYASHLPELPANRTYQLWLVRSSGSAVTSAGIFRPDPTSKAVLQIQDASLLSGVTAFAVTDEPSGGSKSPTGHKWLIGS